MNQIELPIVGRTKNSKNQNRRARKGGQLPVVVYGSNLESRAGYVDGVEFVKKQHTYHSSTIFTLQYDNGGEPDKAIIRTIQYHPVTDRPIHVDFFRIQLDKPIIVEVPVHGVGGVPAGVKLGGVLETLLRHVRIRVLPLQVPEAINIDISGLAISHSIHVSDIPAIEGVEILTPGNEALFTVAVPKAEETATPGEAAQPEVIGAKKEVAGEAAKGDAGKKDAGKKEPAKKEEKKK